MRLWTTPNKWRNRPTSSPSRWSENSANPQTGLNRESTIYSSEIKKGQKTGRKDPGEDDFSGFDDDFGGDDEFGGFEDDDYGGGGDWDDFEVDTGGGWG